MSPCPFCREPIQPAAKKCRYCLEYLPDDWSLDPSQPQPPDSATADPLQNSARPGPAKPRPWRDILWTAGLVLSIAALILTWQFYRRHLNPAASPIPGSAAQFPPAASLSHPDEPYYNYARMAEPPDCPPDIQKLVDEYKALWETVSQAEKDRIERLRKEQEEKDRARTDIQNTSEMVADIFSLLPRSVETLQAENPRLKELETEANAKQSAYDEYVKRVNPAGWESILEQRRARARRNLEWAQQTIAQRAADSARAADADAAASAARDRAHRLRMDGDRQKSRSWVDSFRYGR